MVNKIQVRNVNVIDLGVWDDLVQKEYGRIYSFQQQDGCKSRGSFNFSVPSETYDYKNETLPIECNGSEMGVSFSAWLKANPNEKFVEDSLYDFTSLWWERNFYPDVSMIIEDFHSKGVLDEGEYMIEIDW